MLHRSSPAVLNASRPDGKDGLRFERRGLDPDELKASAPPSNSFIISIKNKQCVSFSLRLAQTSLKVRTVRNLQRPPRLVSVLIRQPFVHFIHPSDFCTCRQDAQSPDPGLSQSHDVTEERGVRRSWFWFLLLSVESRFGDGFLSVWWGGCCFGTLVQRFTPVPLLVQAALAALHHVDKVSERLLLVDGDVPEVTTHRLCQLGFVETWSGLQLVVALVASQCVHLQLEKVHLRHLHIVIWRLSSIIAGLPLPLVAHALDEVLVEVTDVKVSHTLIDVQLEFLL